MVKRMLAPLARTCVTTTKGPMPSGTTTSRCGALRAQRAVWHSLVLPALPPTLPHSQDGDTGMARWQHFHCHDPTAVLPMPVHHLYLQPECLRAAQGWL